MYYLIIFEILLLSAVIFYLYKISGKYKSIITEYKTLVTVLHNLDNLLKIIDMRTINAEKEINNFKSFEPRIRDNSMNIESLRQRINRLENTPLKESNILNEQTINEPIIKKQDNIVRIKREVEFIPNQEKVQEAVITPNKIEKKNNKRIKVKNNSDLHTKMVGKKKIKVVRKIKGK